MSKVRAFTLIELLVVIAIIALLVSILMPSLQKAKEMAKDVVCRSNQRNISYGILLYTEDNDDAFPYNRNLVTGGYAFMYWPQRVGKIPKDQAPSFSNAPDGNRANAICRAGYVDYPSFGSNDRIPYEGAFVCPAFVDQVNPKSTWSGGTSFQYSLSTNYSGHEHTYDFTDEITVTLITDVRPGSVMIGDCNVNPGGNIRVDAAFRCTRDGSLYIQYSQWPDDFGPWCFQRHVGKWSRTWPCDFYGHPGDRANLAFGDGHVEAISQIEHDAWKIR